jgi:transketolase
MCERLSVGKREMRMTASEMDLLCINTIRTLAIDAIQKAKSGHPGTPMGMAPVAYGLWQKRLNFDPADPIWPNRDRFILSAGHASMLLYALLHLTKTQAVDAEYQQLGQPSVTLDDIKAFRQLDSACPGHPEYHLTSGVEATTGPLGQGVAMSVGLAIAERWLGAYFNRPGFEVVDWHTYALCGDGCMMEGISGEAASLAGHLKLEKLCWIYDSNRVSIEGHTEIAFTEDVATRFLGYGWNVLQDSPEAHGEPLGEEEVRDTKRFYDWPADAQFLVPDGVYQHFADGIGQRGAAKHALWRALFARYRDSYSEFAAQFACAARHSQCGSR